MENIRQATPTSTSAALAAAPSNERSALGEQWQATLKLQRGNPAAAENAVRHLENQKKQTHEGERAQAPADTLDLWASKLARYAIARSIMLHSDGTKRAARDAFFYFHELPAAKKEAISQSAAHCLKILMRLDPTQTPNLSQILKKIGLSREHYRELLKRHQNESPPEISAQAALRQLRRMAESEREIKEIVDYAPRFSWWRRLFPEPTLPRAAILEDGDDISPNAELVRITQVIKEPYELAAIFNTFIEKTKASFSEHDLSWVIRHLPDQPVPGGNPTLVDNAARAMGCNDSEYWSVSHSEIDMRIVVLVKILEKMSVVGDTSIITPLSQAIEDKFKNSALGTPAYPTIYQKSKWSQSLRVLVTRRLMDLTGKRAKIQSL